MTKTKENQLVPELRFKEYSEFWSETSLGKMFEFKNGLNSSKDKYGSGKKFINVLDILGDVVITYESIIGKVEVTEKELEKNEVIYGDVLFQRSSETREDAGQANIYVDKKESAVFGGFVIRGRKKTEFNPYFINYLLKTSSARKEVTTKSGGSTRFNVGQESLGQVSIRVTSLPEQKKIASFLSAIDKKIQQLSKKKDLLEQYKKGLMQQLFSGELRFRDAHGEVYPDWEEKRLGEIAIFLKGKGISKSDIVSNGRIPCIRYGELYTHYSETIHDVISKTNLSEDVLVLSEEDDVIIPASGETQIDIATASCVRKANIALGGDLNIIRCTNTNGVFLAYYLNNALKLDIARLSQGVSVVHLYSSQLKTLKLNIPQLKEQQKIATFLSNIDTKIENVNQQILKTQSFKKGLLQQMFV